MLLPLFHCSRVIKSHNCGMQQKHTSLFPTQAVNTLYKLYIIQPLPPQSYSFYLTTPCLLTECAFKFSVLRCAPRLRLCRDPLLSTSSFFFPLPFCLDYSQFYFRCQVQCHFFRRMVPEFLAGDKHPWMHAFLLPQFRFITTIKNIIEFQISISLSK